MDTNIKNAILLLLLVVLTFSVNFKRTKTVIKKIDNERIIAIPCLLIFGICAFVMLFICKRYPEVKADKKGEEVAENDNQEE